MGRANCRIDDRDTVWDEGMTSKIEEQIDKLSDTVHDLSLNVGRLTSTLEAQQKIMDFQIERMKDDHETLKGLVIGHMTDIKELNENIESVRQIVDENINQAKGASKVVVAIWTILGGLGSAIATGLTVWGLLE